MKKVVLLSLMLAVMGAGAGFCLYTLRANRFVERFTYDTKGRIASRVTASGHTVTFSYDPSGRLNRLEYPGRIVNLVFDGNNNLIRSEDSAGATTATYDELDRMTTLVSPSGLSIAYEYDPWGRPIAMTPSGGQRVQYEHDVRGRVVAIFDGKGLTTFDYAPESVVRTLPNGVRTEFQYTPEGELRCLRHFSPKGQLIAEYNYQRDNSGRITAIDEHTPSGRHIRRFAYDALGRLTSATDGSNTTIAYEYDAAGNRVSETRPNAHVTYSYRHGRLDHVGGAKFSWDADGELRERSGERPVHFEFDVSGRLTSIDSGSTHIQYQYDATDLRISREVNGKKTLFLNDISSGRSLVAAEYDSSGKLKVQYIVAGRPLGVRDSSGNTSYYLEDHLGSIRYLTDEAGRVVSAFDYTPFGEPSSPGSGPRFAGEPWDEEAGLLYLHDRYMDPQTGRFLSRDGFPAALNNPQTFNRYAYAANDPVNLVDPTGLAPQHPKSTDDHDPESVQELEKWWNDLAVRQLRQGGIPGQAVAVTSSIEYAFLDHFAKPIEVEVRNLSDPQWVERHPVKRYFEGENLAFDVANLIPIEPTPSAMKISFAESTPLANRIQILQTGEHWTQTRTYLPFGLDRAYPGSKSLRFSLEKAHEAFEAGRDSVDLVKELYRDFSGGSTQDQPHPVGGVRLNGPADWPPDLGAITAASFNSDTGSLIIAGEKQTTLPPVRRDDLAVALRAVLTQGDVSMTINPDPQNPHGPTMNVIFFGRTAGSHLGWVMFECDRLMKGLTVGRDNLTQQPLTIPFPGFRNMVELGLRETAANPHLWSRFWIVPDHVTLRVSPDGRSVVFGETRMRIKTETMRWADGKLVPADGAKDANAELMATELTSHYDALARQYPVFEELRQMARIVALAQWMKQAGVTIDPRWVESNAIGGVPTPDTTPSVENSVSGRNGRLIYTSQVFGGADLISQPEYRQDLATAVVTAALGREWHRNAEKSSFELELGGKPARAVVIATTATRIDGTFQTTLEGPLGLNLYYDSYHRKWSHLLPRLYTQTDPSIRLSLPGQKRSIAAQHFLLSDDFGVRNERFENAFWDSEMGRAGFRSANPVYRGLYPDETGGAVLLLTGGGAWRFDSNGHAIALISKSGETLFTYGSSGLLEGVTGEGHEIRLAYDQDRLVRIAQDGRATYQYAYGNGTLFSATTPEHRFDYSYNLQGQISSIAEDGRLKVQIAYDPQGRWLAQTNGSGQVIANQQFDGPKVVRSGADGSRTTMTYSIDGALSSITAQTPSGQTSAEWSPDRLQLALTDARGTHKEFRFDRNGRVEESRLNGRTVAVYQYDDARRLRIADYEGFQEVVEYGSNGEPVRRRVQPKRSWVHPSGVQPLREMPLSADSIPPLEMETARHDRPQVVTDATGVQTTYSYDPNGKLKTVRLPGGAAIDYAYDRNGRLVEIAE